MFSVDEPRMIRGEMEPEEFSSIKSAESDSIAWKGGGDWYIWKFTMQKVKYFIACTLIMYYLYGARLFLSTYTNFFLSIYTYEYLGRM